MDRIHCAGAGIHNAMIIIIFSAAFMLLALVFNPITAYAQNQATEVKQEPQTVRDKQVVMLIIDGLQNESVDSANTPNINGLAMSAIRVDRVSAMPPENSGGRIYSLLSGTDQSQHAYAGAGTTPLCPGILALLEKKAVGTALIDGTGLMRGAADGISNVNFGPFKNDAGVIDAAIDIFKNKRPFFAVIVLTGPSRAAAMYGAGSKEYAAAVTASDSDVGRFFHHLYNEGFYDNTLLVIAGTTGNMPLIIKGRDFIAGMKLPPVNIKDLAPTLGYLYGAEFTASKGHILWNALKPGPERPENFMLLQRVKDLSNSYADTVDISSRLENEKYAVQEEKAGLTRDKQSIEENMAVKDRQISSLKSVIGFMKIAVILSLAVFFCLLALEYRILKKKFLLFP